MTRKQLARLLSCLLALSLMLIAARADATPKAGSRELRIGQQLQPPLTLTDGFIRLEPEHGEGVTGMGLGAGMGYFLNDTVELGLSLSLQMLKGGSGDAMVGPGLAPFVRFMFFQGKVGYFAELAGEVRRLSQGDNAQTTVTLGGDLGLEFFVTDDWAVRVAPTYRHVIVNTSSSVGSAEVSIDSTSNRFGMTWGLACYF